MVSTFQRSIAETCDPKEKFAIIVHGWVENRNTEWVGDLVSNLTEVRGGCIMVMDYSSSTSYTNFLLTYNFQKLSNVLSRKLTQFKIDGFSPESGYMFGFSYGAQLVLSAARDFGGVQEIDGILFLYKLKFFLTFEYWIVCEPAGFLFDGLQEKSLGPSAAAENVQCIHSTATKDTIKTYCHQNWMMGNCGLSQPAAGVRPKGDHGLCPHFYNSAFKNDFLAMENNNNCTTDNAVADWPEGYRMGYNEKRKHLVQGDLFASTTKLYPYTRGNLTELFT